MGHVIVTVSLDDWFIAVETACLHVNVPRGEYTGGVVGVVQSEASFRDASALRYWSREETNRGGNV